jgi:hypothetical protein
MIKISRKMNKISRNMNKKRKVMEIIPMNISFLLLFLSPFTS